MNSEFRNRRDMATESFLQLGILIFALIIFYTLFNLPRKALSNFRTSGRSQTQAHRHFIQGAQLLSKARSARTSKSTSLTLAKSSITESDKALALNPKDPASHILKALALDLMGHSTSALRSLDVALSPPAVKRLSGAEKADALIKRAELQVGMKRRRRVEAAVADLVEAVALMSEDGNSRVKAFCLLGQCYEIQGLRDEARKAFQEAIRIQPDFGPAHQGLNNL